MHNELSRRTVLHMEISNFEVPPAGEALVLAKRCPLGPEAAKKMLDSAAPGQFELIRLEDDIVEGLLVRSHLFLRADRDSLVKAILAECKTAMGPECMLRVKCSITVSVAKEI